MAADTESIDAASPMKARTSTRCSTRSSAPRMFTATSPNRPRANSEKAMVVMLRALSSGARRKAMSASRKASLTFPHGGHHLLRVVDHLAAVDFHGAVVRAADQVEVVRGHQNGGPRGV